MPSSRSLSYPLAATALSLALLLAQPAVAETMAPKPAAASVEADAAQAMERMGSWLRSLSQFQVRSDGSVESVYAGNQKVQKRLAATYTVTMPAKMLVDVQTDRSQMRVYYNGQLMTVQAVKIGKYTSFPMTGSVADVLAKANERAGLDFPLQDLFRWGSADTPTPSSGVKIGSTTVGGVAATQYAFRQPGVDYQIWIADGAQPMPLKMVIVNTDEPSQPSFTTFLSWNLSPMLSDSSFTFQPGPNDKAVDFGAMQPAGGAAADAK